MVPAKRPFVVQMVFCVSLLCLTLFVQGASAASTITGSIYDRQRNPLSEVNVELLNDYYQSVQRTRTDGSGRYHFGGVSDGRYTIRAYAFQYDLMDQEIPLEIITQTLRGGEGSGFFQQDFYLQPRKGGLADSEIGVVFAQEVSKEAKAAYDKAVKDFGANKTADGIMGLNAALKLEPNYYLALHRMGKELFVMRRYDEAVPFFLKSAEVNSKSATSLYYLGSSLFHMGKDYNKAAIVALSNAQVIAPASVQVLYMLGKAERVGGNAAKSEKHLLQAKKLTKVPVPEIHKELAQLYADDMKKYKEAADELELYLKTSKLDGEASGKTKKVIANLRNKAKSQTGD